MFTNGDTIVSEADYLTLNSNRNKADRPLVTVGKILSTNGDTYNVGWRKANRSYYHTTTKETNDSLRRYRVIQLYRRIVR